MRSKPVAGVLLMLCLAGATSCATAQGTPNVVAAPITTSASAPKPTTSTPPSAPPCALTTGACVSLERKLAWLFRDGRLVRGPVAAEPGDPGQPTPVGTFRVAWKDRVHRSSQYGTDMPNSVFFAAGGIAFHAGSLTTPSHGCVHLSDDDSAAFFDGLAVGDTVQITA